MKKLRQISPNLRYKFSTTLKFSLQILSFEGKIDTVAFKTSFNYEGRPQRKVSDWSRNFLIVILLL